MNYFVIRLPLSYLNAVEAQHYYKIKPQESILVVLCQERYPIDLEIIKEIIDSSLWKEIYYVSYNLASFRKNQTRNKSCNWFFEKINYIRDIKKYVEELDSVRQSDKETEKIIIGNEFTASMRHISNSIRAKEVIVVDEGFAVINVLDKKIKNFNKKFKLFTLKEYIQSILFSFIFGFKLYPLKDIIYFSAYNFSEENSLNVVRNIYKKLRCFSINKKFNQVFLLGQPFVNHHFLTEDAYIDILSQIKHYYYHKEILYCPHRDETPGNIQRIRDELRFEIEESKLPIEYRLSREKNIPQIVSSFYSSALQNIYHIFNNSIEIESFEIDQSDFLCQNMRVLDEIKHCYKYLKNLESQTFRVTKLPLKGRHL